MKGKHNSSAVDKINLKNPWHFLATGMGSGLSPIVPGTMGTLMSVPFYFLLAELPFYGYLVVLLLASLIGIVICQKTSDDMGVHDHGSIVWDEFVGFWLTMAVVPLLSNDLTATHWLIGGFILFRFFDMVKPWPIRWLDRYVHGGFGIMVDDILAAVFAGAGLYLLGLYLGWS